MNSLKLADRSTGLLLFSALLWKQDVPCFYGYILLYLSGSALEARLLQSMFSPDSAKGRFQ